MRGSNSVDGDSDVRLMFYPPLPSADRRRLALGRLAIRFASRPRRGFTLVELLVVVAIIGVLVALLLPAVQAARESSRRSQCANNLRQQGLALIGFEGEHRTLPVGCVDCLEDPKRFHSWNSQLLPWLEQGPLRKQLDFTTPSYEAPNIGVGGTALDVFLCPSTLELEVKNAAKPWKNAAFTDYGGIYGVGGNGQDKDDEDGNKQNLKIAALGVFLCEWVNGNNIFAQDVETHVNDAVKTSVGIGSPHPGGAQVVFCDGHVSFLAEHMDQATLNALLTRSGEELP
jgi:prepilin-type N-terminal cleavage/methylation domain-containing protein/prepilin-type processing-associated H-X9-DG protein